ncbi:hypothetical protein E0K83_01620 [Gramella sp. BOM4]|nr:hypothetical protein [Christiangramia bathymodioli]
MKKLLFLLCMIPFALWSQENEPPIMHVMEFTVKEGHQMKFMDGLKEWKECYKSNGGNTSYTVWNRMMGEGSVVALTFNSPNWAALDDNDEPKVSENCDPLAFEKLMPHVEKSNRLIARVAPEWSRSNPSDGMVAMVTFFKVDDYQTFTSTVEEVTKTMREKEGDVRGNWFRLMGGKDAPDYMVSRIYENFAGMDVKEDGVWKMYGSAKGDSKMKEMRDKFSSSVKDSWTNLYRVNEELSYQANDSQ